MSQIRGIAKSLVGPLVAPLAGISPTHDLFVIVGQSNAEGRGSSGSSPSAPNGLFYNGSVFSALADPVGDADTGSMWPSFSNQWFASTGKDSVFIEVAEGASGLIAATGSPNWSPSGTLRSAAATAANAAITAINDDATKTLGRVYFLWCEGEKDANNINGSTITGTIHESDLEALGDYFKAQVPSMTKMCVFRTGGLVDLTKADDYADIRNAQNSACTDNANLEMSYRGAFSLVARGLMEDNIHYDQAGLNSAGTCAAIAINSGNSAPGDVGEYLASESELDTDINSDSNSLTLDDHTTASGTKAIVVACNANRRGSSAAIEVDTCSFGGTALTRIDSVSRGRAVSPIARSSCALFYIDEDTYGPLSSVTGDVVIGSTGSDGQMLDITVIDLDEVGIVDGIAEASLGSTGSGSSPDITLSEISTVIVVSSAMLGSGTAVTTTINNGNEITDHSTNSATRGGHFAVYYENSVAPAVERTYQLTYSSSYSCVATIAAGFRGKILGE